MVVTLEAAVTRFNELARIQNALKHRGVADLQWALAYCEMRLRIATRKDHIEYWRKLESQVRTAISTLNSIED
jgi:hypothetical protein